jgi:hypothetical protein
MTLICEFAPGAGPLDVIGDHYLLLDGSEAACASTSDHVDLDITGDLDLRAEVTLDEWVVPSYNPYFVSKWAGAANEKSFVLWTYQGRLAIAWTTDGTTATSVTLASNDPLPFESGRHAVRATLDVDDGAGNKVATFYYADSIDGPWTQFDQVTSAGTTSVYASTESLAVGNLDNDSSVPSLVGRVHAVELRNGIDGTVVADPDFTAESAGTTSFSDSTGKTWSVNGTAEIVGYEWVDLSDRILAASWDEGRDDELEHYGPGQATIVLKNDDRLLDPDHTGGTYYGELLPRTPFRLREDVGGTPEDRFYGFVDGGFEQALMPPAAANCTVRLTDRLSAVAGLLPDVFEHSVMAREPVGFWQLDGPSGTEQVADLSGNGHDGTVAGSVTFGEKPIASGHGTSARFDASTTAFGRVEVSRSPIIADPSASSIVATFNARSAGSLNFRTLFIQGDGKASGTGIAVNVDTGGLLRFVWQEGGSGIGYETADAVVDGAGHIMFGQAAGIAVDTATLETTSVPVGTGTANGVGIGGYAGIVIEDHWDGWIGAVAVFDRALDEAEREAILTGYTKLAGQRTDEHIAWALDRLGVPAEHRNLSEGTVLMGTADTKGRDALAYIREVVATEQGEFYCDHRDGGKLRFRSRYERFTDTRSTTAQATFSDGGSSATAVRVERSGLVVTPNGIDGVVNQVQVTWRDGQETVEDSASVARYGPQQRTITTQATTAAQARSAGEWLVANYAQPRSRVRGITTNPGASVNALTAARDLQVGDRVTYRSHPQAVGSPTEIDLFVEGIEHSMSDGTHRTAVYKLAPVHTFTPWTWGVSEWGVDNYWG